MAKKIIIIGAGIAGLSAGCYGQMNGYDTEIYEMHDLPGGLCTGWKRKGYTFDGCIHWLVGTSPKSAFYRYWCELGALQGKEIHNYDEFIRIKTKSGQTAIMYTDLAKLEEHLLELSPEDAPVIKELIRAVKSFAKFELPADKPQELYNLFDKVKMVFQMAPYLKDFIKYSRISIQDFAARFKSGAIRELLLAQGVPSDQVMIALLMTLAWLHTKKTGFPSGGSLAFAKSIEERYLRLGGRIHYKSKVETIIVRNDQAVGIRLADGTEKYGDLILSAADGYSTIYKMLQGQYVDQNIQHLYRDLPTFTAAQVSLGVNCDLSKEPDWVAVNLDQPVDAAGKVIETIPFKHYCFDPSLSPKGKSMVVSVIDCGYESWKKLAVDPEAYRAEKQKLADLVTEELAKLYPETKDRVEAVDVATPLTFERYTNVWQGAFMTWSRTPQTGLIKTSSTLPGLNGFYLIGQWANPAGLPTALITGRNIIQVICKKDGKRFEAKMPS